MSKIFQFLREVKTEMLKVVWPTRNETLKMTLVVVIFASIVAIFLGAIDYGFTKILGIIFTK